MDQGPEGEDARRRHAVVASFETRFADPESVAYARIHAPRYEILLGAVEAAIAGIGGEPVGLLDVGPSFQTEAIRELYPNVRVDSLGFADARFPPPRDGERHIDFDLDNADDPTTWPVADPYDVIVCAEVVEHLHTSPTHVFRLFASLVRSRGTLVLQTPNAAALSRRFWLLAGRNPYEPIRENKRQAGHFREYTAAELLPDRIAEESRPRTPRRSPTDRPAAGDHDHRDEALLIARRRASNHPARTRLSATNHPSRTDGPIGATAAGSCY